jgi:Ca2+-binding EF-hand superfamily protein
MKLVTALTIAAIASASAASASISRIDANDDGVVSKTEFLHVYGPERDVSTFRAADANNDGVIDGAEFKAETSGAGLFENL